MYKEYETKERSNTSITIRLAKIHDVFKGAVSTSSRKVCFGVCIIVLNFGVFFVKYILQVDTALAFMQKYMVF